METVAVETRPIGADRMQAVGGTCKYCGRPVADGPEGRSVTVLADLSEEWFHFTCVRQEGERQRAALREAGERQQDNRVCAYCDRPVPAHGPEGWVHDVSAPGRDLWFHYDCRAKWLEERNRSRSSELVAAPAGRAAVPMLVEDFLPYTLRPTYLVGPFGSMKSYLSLALGLGLAAGRVAVQGLAPARKAPVLYLDFETDEQTFERRLGNLARGLDMPDDEPVPGLFYMRGAGPLASMLHEVRTEARGKGAKLLIVDSAALAAGLDVDFAEAAVRLNAALNAVGVPALVIAQQSWESIEGGKDTRPYGSVLHSYAAGMIWGVRREGDLLLLTQGKASDEAGGRRFALRDEWTEDPPALRFVTADTPRPAPTVTSRIAALLAEGIEDTAAVLGQLAPEGYHPSADTVRKIVSRLRQRASTETGGQGETSETL